MRFWGKFMIGAMLGGLFGALVGLLIAPESGQQIRNRICETVTNIRDEVSAAAASRRAELEEQLIQLRQPPQPGE